MPKVIVMNEDALDIIIDHEKAADIKNDLFNDVNIHIIEEEYDCIFSRKNDYLMVETKDQ